MSLWVLVSICGGIGLLNGLGHLASADVAFNARFWPYLFRPLDRARRRLGRGHGWATTNESFVLGCGFVLLGLLFVTIQLFLALFVAPRMASDWRRRERRIIDGLTGSESVAELQKIKAHAQLQGRLVRQWSDHLEEKARCLERNSVNNLDRHLLDEGRRISEQLEEMANTRAPLLRRLSHYEPLPAQIDDLLADRRQATTERIRQAHRRLSEKAQPAPTPDLAPPAWDPDCPGGIVPPWMKSDDQN